MCGIAGIIQANPERFRQEHLQQMTASIVHRGPDAEGHWCNKSNTVLLGHRRLSVIDLTAAGSQPMPCLGRYYIIHNGEIYNYREIRDELLQKGYRFHSQTDTEVVAAAYDCWKEDCLQKFDGMFAFAIWDAQSNELFAARDRLGEKPFFYCLHDNCFLFASEMKALWKVGVPKIPNRSMLFNFITIGYTSNPEQPGETFYEQIFRLPAATYLKFSFVYFSFSLKKYWNADPEKESAPLSSHDAIEQFSGLLRTSVERRLRSDVAVGSSLSGGPDSASVVAIMHSLAAEDPPQAFTASFPDFEKDELAYAAQVTKTFGLPHHISSVSGHELLQYWDKLCAHQEEPFGSAGIFAQYKVYELASQHNVKVLLDGQGADELLAGYPKYYKWYWQELYRRGKLSSSGERKAALKLGIREPFTWKNKIAAWFPAFASIVMERQYLLRSLRQKDLDPAFVQQHSKAAYYTPPDHFSLNGVLRFNCFTYGLEELLRYADRNSMAHGVEVRLPFLSHQLVEFLFSLPAHFKIRNGWNKWLLRESMTRHLPENIIWRRDKTGFEPPQVQWMQLPEVTDAIQQARKKLVEEKILMPSVQQKPVVPLAAYEANNYDWRYFAASLLFK